jgi:hypothetical protein
MTQHPATEPKIELDYRQLKSAGPAAAKPAQPVDLLKER